VNTRSQEHFIVLLTALSRSIGLRTVALWLVVAGALLAPRIALAQASPTKEQTALNQAVARVLPSLVRLQTVGGSEKVEGVLVGDGATTGIVVDPAGYIVSSAFSFGQRPDGIIAVLPSGKQVAAQLVATDHSRRLVLLRVNSSEPLVVPAAVPVDDVQPGWWAIAVGRAFEPDQPNVSIGIVSAVDRVWGKAIQTDAKISPANYGGPLLDIEGRVMGVLVPLSPQASGITAGVDWYDSGIGFAIPYEHIVVSWKRMREGNDLHPGLLGMALRGENLFGPAILAGARVGSPAATAGLRTGDEIVSINRRRTEHQAAVKTELGRLYAGDRAHVVVRRNDQNFDYDIELIDKLAPYERPFLGILPAPIAADDKKPPAGVGVRWVFPDSPAAAAGIAAGDRIVKVGDNGIKDRPALVEALSELPIGADIQLTLDHDGQSRQVTAKLSAEPTAIAVDAPPRDPLSGEAPKPAPATGDTEIKLPEFENKLTAYVPADYDARRAYGLVILLNPAGGAANPKTLAQWKPLCDRHGLILLVPSPKDSKRWDPSETAMLRRAAMQLIGQYNIDRQRVALVGQESGGSMAWLLALSARGLVRGLAVIESPLPLGSEVPQTDPATPLSIYAAASEPAQKNGRIAKTLESLRAAKFAVTAHSLGDQARPLDEAELADLARWIDTLDRL